MKKLTLLLFSIIFAAFSYGQSSLTVINNIGCDIQMGLIYHAAPPSCSAVNQTAVTSTSSTSVTYNAPGGGTYVAIDQIQIVNEPLACLQSVSQSTNFLSYSGTPPCPGCNSPAIGAVNVANFSSACANCSSNFTVTYDFCAQTVTIN